MKPEAILISRLDLRLARQAPDLSRGPMIDLLDAGVESPYATEPGGNGNLTHGQTGLVDELFCEVQTAGLSHSHRRRPQVSQEQASKMSRSNSQAFCQYFYSSILQTALSDQSQSSRNRA
jgi:hypothetical protein